MPTHPYWSPNSTSTPVQPLFVSQSGIPTIQAIQAHDHPLPMQSIIPLPQETDATVNLLGFLADETIFWDIRTSIVPSASSYDQYQNGSIGWWHRPATNPGLRSMDIRCAAFDTPIVVTPEFTFELLVWDVLTAIHRKATMPANLWAGYGGQIDSPMDPRDIQEHSLLLGVEEPSMSCSSSTNNWIWAGMEPCLEEPGVWILHLRGQNALLDELW
ncbi:hypothetical protein FA15DRAFT_674120 [Coprinopsis marcescibilis]|uniref:DUF6699 domain-containing protein n=1 Tax=Coprinopsis marcescibilis TaxID=230819 RepID=A0A5C3KIU7_COPMA|nr:hypothetical protein FA15DRAFT_674120 [Coprinopsis marcescibilis]